MSTIVAMGKTLKIRFDQIPLEKWRFDIGWEVGEFYPLIPYGGPETLAVESERIYAILQITKQPLGMKLWARICTSGDELKRVSMQQDATPLCNTKDFRVSRRAFLNRRGNRGAFVAELDGKW